MAKERIYPFAVASVRSMENKLLTKQKLLQMAEAKDAEEALRFLQDSDYGKTQIGDVHEFETMIQANLEEAYQAMGKLIPKRLSQCEGAHQGGNFQGKRQEIPDSGRFDSRRGFTEILP